MLPVNRIAWLGVFCVSVKISNVSTLVDNALSANSPIVTVCVQCAHTCCTRPCACMSCSFTRRVSTRCLVRLRVGGDLLLRDL